LAGTCLLLGGLLGFLFGIPRSLQHDRPPPPAENGGRKDRAGEPIALRYGANTNLEQISDWLTKILVGFGLTQIEKIPSYLGAVAGYFGTFLGTGAHGDKIAMTIILFFATCGFLFGYLWTRLYLAGELTRADITTVTEAVRALEDAQAEQADIDARALALTNQYLNIETHHSKFTVEELKAAIIASSPSVKVQIFYLASSTRSDNWREPADKPLMERTIPIFQALIDSDKDQRFHANHGQLGFALKDKRAPDWGAAEAELSKAIEMRGPSREQGWELYEFNRAICRIQLDPEFRAGRESATDQRTRVLDDLRIAARGVRHYLAVEPVKTWLALNKAKDAEIDPA